MRIILVYGGSPIANDPANFTLDRIKSVLEELEVETKCFDLHEDTYDNEQFFNDLIESDGVVLGITVEWLGIGGRMQTFMDQCYKYGKPADFNDKYLMAVVLSKKHGERDALNHLLQSWEMLGGLEGQTICGMVNDAIEIENSPALLSIIDKKTEDYYRIVHQKRSQIPKSINYLSPKSVDTYNLSDVQHTIENESTVKNHKHSILNHDNAHQKDITIIANRFKRQLDQDSDSNSNPQLYHLKNAFKGADEDKNYRYLIKQTDTNEEIGIIIRNGEIEVILGTIMHPDVVMHLTEDKMNQVLDGKLTTHRAFMTGELSAKGNIGLVYEFDKLFEFI